MAVSFLIFAWSRDALGESGPELWKSRRGGGPLDELVLHCRITHDSNQISFPGDSELRVVRYILSLSAL